MDENAQSNHQIGNDREFQNQAVALDLRLDSVIKYLRINYNLSQHDFDLPPKAIPDSHCDSPT